MKRFPELACLTAAILLGLALNSPRPAQADVITNDVCSGATVISPTGPFPYLSPLLTNILSATVTNDPPCPTDCVLHCTNLSSSVWYKFRPPQGGLYTFSVGLDTGTTVADTVMGIYTSASCTGPFVPLKCNDDASGYGAATRSGVAAELTANVTYYIVVWARFPMEPDVAVQLRVAKPQAPTNDPCTGATVITLPASLPYFTLPVDTYAATNSGDPVPSCNNGQLVRSVWYKFAPTTTAKYIISACPKATASTLQDSFVAIYSSSSGTCSTLSQVACTNGGCDVSASLQVTLNAGTTYYLVVWEYFPANEPDTSPVVGETLVQLIVADPRPVIIDRRRDSNSFWLQFRGVGGQLYQVLASNNLNTWSSVGLATYKGQNLFEFTHNSATTPYRFYRVKLL